MTTSRVPLRTDDPTRARDLVRQHGAAILTGQGTSPEDAVATAIAVFVDEVLAVPPPSEVRIGGDRDRRLPQIDQSTPLSVHTDGFAYGELYPDFFLLCCAQDSPVGGESFLVDGHSVIANLARSSGDADILQRLQQVAVDQTEPGMQPSLTPVIGRTTGGRLMLRRFPYQRPAADSAHPADDQAMLDRWHAAVEAAADEAPRFRLRPGDVAVIDNYRMLHGREAYVDMNRLMWRVWVWTTSAFGVPAGQLHSDSRYAATG